MPYGSKKPYGTQTSRRGRGSKAKKKTPNNKQLAKRIRRLENAPELKYEDVLDSSSWDGTGHAHSCTTLAQSDSIDGRVGLEVTAKYLDISCTVYRTLAQNALDPMSAYAFRMIVFWDKQANANTAFSAFTNAVGSTTDTLRATALLDNLAGQNVLNAFPNYPTRDRFTILYDKVYHMNPKASIWDAGNSVPASADISMHIKKRINLHNAIIKYGSSDPTQVGLASRNLVVFFVSTYAGSADNTTNCITRFWYTDQ